MAKVRLVEHDERYAERLLALSSHPDIQQALGLHVSTRADILTYIRQMQAQERQGKVVSRVILDERDRPVGVTTLMLIDRWRKRCHIATWLGAPYWHRGYNLASKNMILALAFDQLGMEIVFSGVRKRNLRSLRAQAKLPYIRLDLAHEFPGEHEMLEAKEREPCVLNAFLASDFRRHQAQQQRERVVVEHLPAWSQAAFHGLSAGMEAPAAARLP